MSVSFLKLLIVEEQRQVEPPKTVGWEGPSKIVKLGVPLVDLYGFIRPIFYRVNSSSISSFMDFYGRNCIDGCWLWFATERYHEDLASAKST